MKNLLFLTALIAACAAPAQEREVNVGAFTELSHGIGGSLYLKQGAEDKVVVEAPRDIFDEIEFENKGGRLMIRNRRNNWNWRGGRSSIKIYVTMREIEYLGSSGSGSIESDGLLRTDDLDLRCSGSGNMVLRIDSDDLDIRISGSGNIELEGSGTYAQTRISGSGRIRARDLEVKTLEASISGSGSIYMTVQEEIEGRISGSGSIYYDGDPDRVHSNSSGSGKLRRL
ncbi:MAG: head GIN domain-containing protein [Bacteroidota bacterium]